jgi:hypothetical protein
VSKIAISFDTSEYRRSHGREPRGHGSWAFDLGRGPEFIPGSCTYGEAKKRIREIAAARFANIPAHLCRTLVINVCT